MAHGGGELQQAFTNGAGVKRGKRRQAGVKANGEIVPDPNDAEEGYKTVWNFATEVWEYKDDDAAQSAMKDVKIARLEERNESIVKQAKLQIKIATLEGRLAALEQPGDVN